MSENPGHKVPWLYAVKAAYTFFDRDEVAPNVCGKGTGNWQWRG